MRKLLSLLLLLILTPLTSKAGGYELKITYDPYSKDMRHGMMKSFAGTYEFSSKSAYYEAQAAYEEFIDRLNTFDREVLRDTEGTEQQQYQRFLARLARCREAASALQSALAMGKRY